MFTGERIYLKSLSVTVSRDEFFFSQLKVFFKNILILAALVVIWKACILKAKIIVTKWERPDTSSVMEKDLNEFDFNHWLKRAFEEGSGMTIFFLFFSPLSVEDKNL